MKTKENCMYCVETAFTFEAAHRLYNVNTYSKDCQYGGVKHENRQNA